MLKEILSHFLTLMTFGKKVFLRTSLSTLRKDGSAIATICLYRKIYPKEWPPKRILRLKLVNTFQRFT